MITNPQHALVFGAINFIGTDAELAANGYRFEALADTTDFSNPVPVDQQVDSWLQDGSIISSLKSDNRPDMVIRIRVVGTNSNYLALAEQALVFETGKPNTLTWTPPDGDGAPSVFDVAMSHLEHDMDDLGELQVKPERIYRLVIQAEPFVRADTLASVTVPAPSGTQTLTLVDNCNVTTGWTQIITPFGGSPTTSTAGNGGTFVYALTSGAGVGPSNPVTATVRRSSLSVSLSGTPYIRIDADDYGSLAYASGVAGLTFKLNGIAAPVAAQTGTVYWFDASALSITTLTTIEVTAYGYFNGNFSIEIGVNQVDRSNILGEVGTKRQLSRTLPVAGSARTQGNLALEDPSVSLGSVLVYTCPSVSGMASPNLRQYKTVSGPTTTDATTVSGATNDMGDNSGAPIEFDIPVNAIVPGGHVLLARLKYSSSATLAVGWGGYSKAGSNLVVGSGFGGTTSVALQTSFGIYELGPLNLPTFRLGTGGAVNIIIQAPSGVIFDEAWLFNLDSGRLTWVECGTGAPAAAGASNRLFMDAPSLASPRPAVFLGTAADRSDQYHAGGGSGFKSFGNHEFVPPSTTVFTVTTHSQAAVLTLSHYPRFHSHVAA